MLLRPSHGIFRCVERTPPRRSAVPSSTTDYPNSTAGGRTQPPCGLSRGFSDPPPLAIHFSSCCYAMRVSEAPVLCYSRGGVYSPPGWLRSAPLPLIPAPAVSCNRWRRLPPCSSRRGGPLGGVAGLYQHASTSEEPVAPIRPRSSPPGRRRRGPRRASDISALRDVPCPVAPLAAPSRRAVCVHGAWAECQEPASLRRDVHGAAASSSVRAIGVCSALPSSATSICLWLRANILIVHPGSLATERGPSG